MRWDAPSLVGETLHRTRDLLNERLSLVDLRADVRAVKGHKIGVVAFLSRVEELAIEPAHALGKTSRRDPMVIEECPDATVLWGGMPFGPQEGGNRVEAA